MFPKFSRCIPEDISNPAFGVLSYLSKNWFELTVSPSTRHFLLAAAWVISALLGYRIFLAPAAFFFTLFFNEFNIADTRFAA